MSEISRFIARTRAYCEDRNVSRSTLSRKLLGNGKRLDEIEGGSSLRLDTFEKANTLLGEMELAPKPASTSTPTQQEIAA